MASDIRIGRLVAGLALLLSFTPVARSSTVNLGILSFDVLIPGSPGVNVFDIDNFTGDPALSGFALPPDFPILTFVTLQNASLLLNGTETPITLPDIAPGFLDSASAPQFSSDVLFTSALFTATLSQTTLSLAGGGTFIASPAITATLLPSSGPDLIAGTDLVLLQATSAPSGPGVPEPSTSALFTLSILAAIITRLANLVGQDSIPRGGCQPPPSAQPLLKQEIPK